MQTRKIVQLTTMFYIDRGNENCAVYALCNDHTVWAQKIWDREYLGWHRLPDIPQDDFDPALVSGTGDDSEIPCVFTAPKAP